MIKPDRAWYLEHDFAASMAIDLRRYPEVVLPSAYQLEGAKAPIK